MVYSCWLLAYNGFYRDWEVSGQVGANADREEPGQSTSDTIGSNAPLCYFSYIQNTIMSVKYQYKLEEYQFLSSPDISE